MNTTPPSGRFSAAIFPPWAATISLGHGHFDLKSYESFLAGEMEDYDYPQEKVAAAMEQVPVVA